MVLHAERDVVAGLHAGRAQQPGEAVRSGVELAVRRDGAGRGHDEGGLVGLGVDESAGVHDLEGSPGTVVP